MATVYGSVLPPRPDRPLMPIGRVIAAYLAEAKYEFLGIARTATFAIPFLVLPLAMYLLIGVGMYREAVTHNPGLADQLFCGFAVLAIMGPAMIGIGSSLANERDAGLMKLRRALPAPSGACIIAKMAMAVVFATLAFALLLVAGLLVGRLTSSAPQLAGVAVVTILGALPFCAIGLFVGAHASVAAAPPTLNLIYLPMLWLGGLFLPLPEVMKSAEPFFPTFHLKQLAMSATSAPERLLVPLSLSVGILLAVTLLFGGLALRKLARTG